ncbi:right-handed parallel beta-helix repeat-containing protein [Hahella ganghwensis]|uniref:right-handed parallel beta-helix repeat-containing protein n=1 Tax=Hahella ganghwensis TaxID=286420 RepID=UPI0003702077
MIGWHLSQKLCLISLLILLIVSGRVSAASEEVTSTGTGETEQSTIVVKDSKDLINTIALANNLGYTTVLLKDGIYRIKKTLVITGDHISIASYSGDRTKVILRGNGMRGSKKVENLIRVSGKYFSLDGVTLEQAGNHLLQIAGEKDADFPSIRNCILRDSYEQLLKVSYNRKTRIASDFGVIENSLFEYSAGIGPQYYIGGIDVHGGQGWIVRNNVFKDIASPSKHIAEHAIHFWNRTRDTLVEGNVIIDSDRGIGFGLINRPNEGGIIRNNVIYHSDNDDPYADAAIIVEESPNTVIEGNRIYQAHSYPNAIEYRFEETTNVVIRNNISNKKIERRDGANGQVGGNKIELELTNVIGPETLQKHGLAF